jgi:hypothetical protein
MMPGHGSSRALKHAAKHQIVLNLLGRGLAAPNLVKSAIAAPMAMQQLTAAWCSQFHQQHVSRLCGLLKFQESMQHTAYNTNNNESKHELSTHRQYSQM